jgi:uncharacterized protein
MPAEHPPRDALRDVAGTYLAVAVVCFVAGLLRGTWLGPELAPTLIAGAFLFTALEKARRDEGGAARFGIALGGLLAPRGEGEGHDLRAVARSALREIGVALGLAAVTFTPYAFAYAYYHAPVRPFSLEGVSIPASFVAGQLIVVALPEEAFFRGFVQTRLTDAFPATRRVFGVRISAPALFVQAGLFALVHVIVTPDPARLAVFFPGLLFGVLREWRGGIGAALVYHALSNVFAEVLFQAMM